MPINLDRARDVHEYVEKHGIESAQEFFGVSYDSITRYLRRFKQLSDDERQFPKILLFDIETLPMWIRVWGLYKQCPQINQIVKDWIVLSWAAKWLHAPNTMSDILSQKEIKERDDKRICTSIWNLIDQADIIMAHNAVRFDVRKLNSRFMIHGMNPPSPYQTIDTLRHSQNIAAHTSHKLDWLGQLMRNKGKISTDYDLWIRCENGEQEALDYMLAYNIEDVGLLEEVYLWMRPWMKSHPNVGIYMDLTEQVCSHCGSNNVHEIDKPYATPAGRYTAVRCGDCGAIGRLRDNMLTLAEKRTLTRSTSR